MEENQNHLQENEKTTETEQPIQETFSQEKQEEKQQQNSSAWQQRPPIPPQQTVNNVSQPSPVHQPYTPPQMNQQYRGPYQYQSQIYPAQKNNSGFAIASLVLGICSLVFFFCGLGTVGSIIGIILGIISLAKKYDNKGMAIAGIILCSIGIILTISLGVFYIIMIAAEDPFFIP